MKEQYEQRKRKQHLPKINPTKVGGFQRMKKKLKVLILYAGIGGESKLWNRDKCDITAIEINPKIAKIRQELQPKDKVIVGDLIDGTKSFYFENDIVIKGNLKCKNYIAHKSIKIEGSNATFGFQEVRELE